MTVRVMVVDDSALYRQLIRNVLRDVPDVEVVGVASSGNEALARIDKCNPQLLTLDVEMPGINGILLLKELRDRRSPVKAIMLSNLTAKGTDTTTDALLAGAFDFIQKPNSRDAEANRRVLLQSLTQKIGAFLESLATKSTRRICDAADNDTGDRGSTVVRETRGVSRARETGRIEAVLIGASTGGPVALREVLPKLTPNLGVPVFVVQHMPARFTNSLAARLHESSQLPIVEGAEGMAIVANSIYIAPGGFQMSIAQSNGQRILRTNEDPPEHNCRPAVDYLFRSAVDAYAGNVLGVILTGMGRDGTEGCRLIKQRGGKVIAQHPDGCVVYGMPKSVVEEQLADRVVPLEKIASWIVRIVENRAKEVPA
jgi:two-component system, chemotaxis family, protein-glutamate methylesterase/glutaminase